MAIKIVVLLMLLFTHCAHAAEPCFPNTFVDEGSSYTLTRYVDIARLPKGLLLWQASTLPNGTTIVTDCQVERSPRCRSFVFEKFYTSTMEDWNKTQYKVTLTLHNVSRIRDHATWTWGDGQNALGSCDLTVSTFRFPPSCNAIIYNPLLHQISWVCIIQNVYPKVSCQFVYSSVTSSSEVPILSTTKEVSPEYINPRLSKRDGELPPRTTLYDLECILSLSVDELSASQLYVFTFSAVMTLETGIQRSKTFGAAELYIPASSTSSTSTTTTTPTTNPSNTSATTTSHVGVSPTPFWCPHQPGFFYPHSSDCRLYMTCENGVFAVHKCRSGKVFSEVVGACVEFNTVLDTCSRSNPTSGCSIRSDNKDFQIPHPSLCRMYYQCKMDSKSKSSYYITTSCPSPQLFDLVEKRCKGPDETFCGFERAK